MNILSRLRDTFDRMTVRRQLLGAFSLILLLTALVGGVAVVGLARVETQAEALAGKWLEGVGRLAELRTGLVDSRELEVKHSRTADGSYHSEYEEKIGAAAKAAGAVLGTYESTVKNDAERELFGKLGKGWAAYQKAAQKVVALGREKKQQDAADISDGVASMAFDEALGALDALTKYNFENGKEAAALTASIHDRARGLILALLAAALVFGIGLAYAITHHLLRQLGGEPGTAADVARAVAEGDLTTPIRLHSGDTESLMARLQSMQSSLADAVANVRRGSENVATASAEIAQGNQDLSNRTEQQASALEKTAATMGVLGSTVRNNADNALQANRLALGASEVARKGGTVVGQVVETMKGINDSSRRIGDIIAVIDGIAFQTNILALNAAVEAARAGEQGRGFAVVAGEVRSLAKRSAEAAKEIKLLINASVERVEHGTALVDEAGQTMGEIVGAIKRVTDIVGEISSASAEQSAGVAEVGQAVTQMDQATQQNAALVEQSAAAADGMRQQAQQLVEAVAVFKLRHGDRHGAAAMPAAATLSAPKPRPAPAPTYNTAATTQPPPLGVERRGPNRATNVARLKPGHTGPAARTAAPAKAAAPVGAVSDEWETF